MMTPDCRPLCTLTETNSGAIVVYTVVSRGRVLGTTELEYVRATERSRAGSFWPEPGVESLMEIAVGVSPALMTAYKAELFDPPDDYDERTRAARAARQKATTEHADVQSAYDREEALELELHGPDGSLIETEDIGIRDTEFALSLVNADVERELDEELALDEDNPSSDELGELEQEMLGEHDEWSLDLDPRCDEPPRPFPRYQIFVQLIDDADVL